MKLVSIPEERYEEYRLNAIFDCYKWDPQFLDSRTVSEYALIITEEEYKEVAKLTEKLDKETKEMMKKGIWLEFVFEGTNY